MCTICYTLRAGGIRSLLVLRILLFVLFWVALRSGEVRAQGYHVEGNRIVVEGEDWEAWIQPKGVLENDATGGLRPRLVSGPINACLNAADFGAEAKGGSNVEAIPYVMDGDPSTFWEPADVDSLGGCWLQIDLGRCVTASKVILRFAEEGQGDPFLQFRAEISNGWKGWQGRDPLSFKKLWETTEPNEDRRYFEVELSLPFKDSSRQLAGEGVRYVRVRMTGTRGDRREEVPAEVYSTLAREDRGRVEYFRITAAGDEALTSPEEYAILPAEEKGSVHYYRRERPRLTEVEVWSFGPNLMLGLVDRGGKVEAWKAQNAIYALDGDYTTRFQLPRSKTEAYSSLLVDLGVPFWVDTIRLIAVEGWWYPFGYRIQVSDGSLGVGGDYVWTTVTPEAQWENAQGSGAYDELGTYEWGGTYQASIYEHAFRPSKVRFLRLLYRTTQEWGSLDLMEWQISGGGYMPDLMLTSDLIDAGASHQITAVGWEADTPPGTRIEVQTRTGNQVDEEKHYFNKDGVEVTAFQWQYKLPGFMKGPVQIHYVPGSDWSPWSRVVEYAGAPFQSPAPRRYLQARVRLVSDDPHQRPVLRALSFSFGVPLVERATGRLSPEEVRRAGVPEVFSLRLHPALRPSDLGFDQVLIKASPGVQMDLIGVDLTRKGQTVEVTDSLTVHPTSGDSLWIQLPTMVRSGGPEEIEIRFQSAIYRDGTPFDVFLGNRAVPTSWQQAESEAFHPFLRTFVVRIPTTDRGLMNVKIAPRTFSPNGDGIHDEMAIHFTVASVRGPKQPVVTIYDLRGQSVRHLSTYREEAAGDYALLWDGRNDEGERVPPGVYVVSVEVHSDEPTAVQRSKAQPAQVIY